MADTVTEERLREILAGCEGVTPGPWEARADPSHYDSATDIYAQGFIIAQACGKSFDGMEARAAHIARLDPDTVASMARLALEALASRRSGEAVGVTDGFTESDFIDTASQLRSGHEAIVRAALSNRFNIILAALDRAALTPPVPVGATTDETGWVLERADSDPATPWYWAAGQIDPTRSSAWTMNHMAAIRFARSEDAEAVASRLMRKADIVVRVCEHSWVTTHKDNSHGQ